MTALLLSWPAAAADWSVPRDFATIQAAIDSPDVADGDRILVGDYTGGVVADNVVSHNRISGTVHVSAGDCGGYSATGIVIYADFRWGAPGALHIAHNRVIKNQIALTSDTPPVVDAVALELTEAEDPDPLTHVIHDNAVGFNDLRGTTLQIALTPVDLDTTNAISRNLGDNRGHGLHPRALLD